MEKNKTLKLITAALALAALTVPVSANQMGFGKARQVNAAGMSADFAHSKELNDGGLYASYRLGFAHIVSLFFSTDAGYRFKAGSVNARAGGQIMFVFIGIETGFLSAYRVRKEEKKIYDPGNTRRPWAPGAYIGLAGVIPGKRFAAFLSLGGNFYFMNHDHEFYIMATGLVNFANN